GLTLGTSAVGRAALRRRTGGPLVSDVELRLVLDQRGLCIEGRTAPTPCDALLTPEGELICHRLFGTLQHAPVATALLGLDGRFEQVNLACAELLGRTATTMRQLTFADVSHPDDVEASTAFLRQVLAGTVSSYEFDKRCVRADGQ